MTTHYDVLGVGADASSDDIRRAYHERARLLHPDRFGNRESDDVDSARRAMQDINEAWRVLRDAGSRAAYDRSLATAPAQTWHAPTDPDEPYQHPTAEPGDLTVAVVRAVPWVAVLVILTIIFVFTAFARRGDDPRDVVGRCVVIEGRTPDPVSCDQPNHGRVVDLVDTTTACPTNSRAVEGAGGRWYCLEV